MIPTQRADPASVEVLTEALKKLHVAIGHARLYGAEHKETARAMAESLDMMGPLLASFGAIDLDSSQEGLFWREVNVHPETDELLGLGRLLHREGIAMLSLARGIELDELGRLLDVLRINFELPEYEEDTLESLLWQAGFDRVGFQAVSALMEAEALSGRLAGGDGVAQQKVDVDAEIRRIVELHLSESAESEGNLLGQVSEEVVTRAVAQSDLAGLGPSEEIRRVDEENRRWEVRFAEEGTEDAEAIAELRQQVERETPSDLLTRVTILLMRSILADRGELSTDDSLALARHAVEDIYRRRDTVGLVRVLDAGTALLEEAGAADSPHAGVVREFFANAVSSRRIARVLLTLDPATVGDGGHLVKLVERLPDTVLQAVLAQAGRDKDEERGQALRDVLSMVVGDRVDAWLKDSAMKPPERLLPTIGLARSLGRAELRRHRPELLAHSSRLVREEVLRWYQEDLPQDELRFVLPQVVDPHHSVRKAAAKALVANRNRDAMLWLQRLVEGPSFGERAADMKRDACITLGLLGGDSAVDTLEKMFNQKTGRLGKDAKVTSDIEAAARGLAAAGTPRARQALKRATGGLFSANKKAAQAALERLDGSKPW